MHTRRQGLDIVIVTVVIKAPHIKRCLKNVFEPNPGVGPAFQLLEIPEYVCGLKLGPALALGPNPIF